MKILALEFSSAHRSVALLENSGGNGEPKCGGFAETTDIHSTGVGLIEQVLREAATSPKQVDVLAVGLGPGSYAGIRSAIAIAQGWQLALNTKLLGIGSVEVLAAEARKRGYRGEVAIIVDAQRKEIYEASFVIGDSDSRPVSALRIISPSEIAPNRPVLGPDAAKLVSGGLDLYPSAVTLGQLALGRSGYLPGEKLEPIYLREASFAKAPPSPYLRSST